MDEHPLVSIVTPSYNQGKFIEDTLSSVKNQDYPNIEHIVVDGGSTDDTLGILEKFEKKYNLRWFSEPDKGQSDAINKGFTMSKGEIIGWLNSDDVYFDKQAVSYIVEQFKSCHDIDVIHGDSLLINQDNLIFRVRPAFPWFSYGRLLRGNIIIQSAAFFRRSVVQSNKLDISLDLVMDYEYWLRLIKAGLKFKRVNRVLSANRIHPAAKARLRNQEERGAEKRRVQETYEQKFDVWYQLLKLFDTLILEPLKRIRGLKLILKLYTNFEYRDLAFPAKFDSCPKMMLRQLFPFV
jgi:glycosyltransferase involved in cell wall biosynthesis